jgi:predicted PhzF superfamily epimerase YddE/YHI9
MKFPVAFYKVFNHKELNYEGNTSSVVFLDSEPMDKKKLQQLASDFNQPATTYLWPIEENRFGVRWFAPDGEIDLCGHGTAAAVAYLKDEKIDDSPQLIYAGGSISSNPSVDNQISFDISKIPVIEKVEVSADILNGFGVLVKAHYRTSNKDIILLNTESDLRKMKPNFALLAKLEPFGYVVTAEGSKSDIVCRTIVPKVQQLEDHATGSSHAVVVPFWSELLNKKKITSRQLSPRGGYFECFVNKDVVTLTGNYERFGEGKTKF